MRVLLVSAKVGPFKSIDTPQTVQIERDVTVLVGMNEAGKTVFLQALEKSADAVGSAKFDPVEDYPRKDFTAYMRRHKTDPDDVTELWFRLEKAEVQTLNSTLHLAIPEDLVFSVRHTYANGINVGLHLDEAPALSALIEGSGLSQSAKTAAQTAKRLRDIPSA